ADLYEALEELAELDPLEAHARPRLGLAVKALDRLGERLALDEAHGVARPAIGVADQAVDRHDTGVLQAGGQFGFGEEAAAVRRFVGVPRADALQGDVAVQL